MDLNRLYKLEKKSDPALVSEKLKWEAVLLSKKDRIVQSALYLSQQVLQLEAGIEIFKDLLYSEEDMVVVNVMHCLVNFVHHKTLGETMKTKGFSRLLEAIERIKDSDKKVLCLQFFCNTLSTTPTLQDVFIHDGGLAMTVEVLGSDSDEQLSIAALQIFTHLVMVRQRTHDYAIFATEKSFLALNKILQQNEKYDNRTLQHILSLMVTLVQTDENRALFKLTKGVPCTVSVLKKNTALEQIAVRLLSNIIMDRECATEIVDCGGVPHILSCLHSPDPQTVLSALGALSNLAFQEEIVDLALEDMEKNNTFQKILDHMNSPIPELKNRAVRTVSNLLAHEQVQPLFKETGGIRNLLNLANSEKSDTETKIRAVTAIFHMTMHNDGMRNYVIQTGLDELAALLTAQHQPVGLRKEVAKAMINMTFADDEIFAGKKTAVTSLLVAVSKGDVEVQELAAVALENLSSNPAVNVRIEQAGGVTASMEFASLAQTPAAQERVALLVARFAVNSKMRAQYQRMNVGEVLEKMAVKGDGPLREAVRLALHHVNIQHYEDQIVPEIPENAYPEFENFDLDSEGENDDEVFFRAENYDTDSESEVEFSDSGSSLEGDDRLLGIIPENSDQKKITITTASLVGERSTTLPLQGITPDPEDEETVDHSIAKEYYTIDDEAAVLDPVIPRNSPGKTKGRIGFHNVSILPKSMPQIVVLPSTNLGGLGEFRSENKSLPDKHLAEARSRASGKFKSKSPKTNLKRLMRSVSPGKSSKPPPTADPERLKQAKMHFKRTKVAQELLTTEGNYVRNLAITIKKYQNPLLQMVRSKKPLLKEIQIKSIFSSIETLFSYNSILLETLNQRMARWSTIQVIGDIFVDMADSFKVYTDYINNFDNSQQTLSKATVMSPKLSRWLESTSQSEICKGQTLVSYLIAPVQRLPRYSLLLKELKSATPDDHPDSAQLTTAIEKINEVNNYLNDKKKEAEHQFKMVELSEKLVGDTAKLFKSKRIFQMETECTWHDKENNKKAKGGIYIFNDAILFTKSVKKKQKIIEVISIDNIKGLMDKSVSNKVVVRYDDRFFKSSHILEFKFESTHEAVMVMETLKRFSKVKF